MQVAEPNFLWGARGHHMVNRLAARHIPPAMPDFFRQSASMLEASGDLPDRWRFRSLRMLGDDNAKDHYINRELVGDREYPATRSQFVEMLVRENIGTAGKVASTVGMLPYRIGEMFETLVADFALWRAEVEANGADTPLARMLANDAVQTAGVMGHFVADASQPLHTTAHYDGWNPDVEPNPEEFNTGKGIHSRLETAYVNRNIDEARVEARMAEPRQLTGSPLDIAQALIHDSHGHVRTVYRLDKDGKLSPGKPSAEATELIEGRLAAGAQTLRDLWYTAWMRSADLAAEASVPSSRGAC